MQRGARNLFAGGSVIATVLLGVFGGSMSKIDTAIACAATSGKNPNPLIQLLHGYQVHIIIILGIVAVAHPLLTIIDSRKSSIRSFLQYLHRRSWGLAGGRDADFRVSFFVPGLVGSHLKCCYRTDGHTPKRKWLKLAPQGSDGDGVVGYVYQQGSEWRVDGITSELLADPEAPEVKKYKADAFITYVELQERSWKGAGMVGLPVYTNTADEPIGVLLIECRVPDKEVELPVPKRFNRDAEVCGLIWEGRL